MSDHSLLTEEALAGLSPANAKTLKDLDAALALFRGEGTAGLAEVWAAGKRLATALRMFADYQIRERARAARLQRRVEDAEALTLVPGHWTCPKCRLPLWVSTLHGNGRMTAEVLPQTCPNGCGPMWRVSERQARQDAERRFVAAHDEIQRLLSRLDQRQTELLAANNRDLERRRIAERRVKILETALRAHHDWHQQTGSWWVKDDKGELIELDMSEGYADSALCERTIAALDGSTA